MVNVQEVSSRELEKLDKLAWWMDSKFVIPGTSIRFGLDVILGLVPGIGDTGSLLISAYLIGKARSYNVPWYVTVQMIWNAFLDWIIGIIPLVGDLFDIGWKANLRNVSLIRQHGQFRP